MTIEKTLAERGKTYGPFLDKAKTVQALIDVVIHEPGWERLAADQKQCIMVCFDKFARAIHGDPNHRDNFHDVVGYAKLVDDRMAADELQLVEDVVLDRLEEGWKPIIDEECPVAPGTMIDVLYRDGDEGYALPAHEDSDGVSKLGKECSAEYFGADGDIIAYRLSSAPRT